MAKPKVFVSSTYYDLRHIRNSLEAFIEGMGYEAVLFESGDIPFRHDIPIDESCYSEISNCHLLVLIIGGRFGSPTSEMEGAKINGEEEQYRYYNSITQKEYERARERDIPVFIFVDKNVYAEYDTYQKNRDNSSINYVHVDSINVFKLLDEILSQRRNNYVREFEKFDDISSWLRDQWAGLFADFLSRTSRETSISNLASQVSELSNVTSVLKEYTESIMRKVQPDESKDIILREEQRLTNFKIRRFQKEPMIEYVIKEYKISPTKVYRALEKSKNLLGFLKNSGLKKDEIEYTMSKHEKEARRDFRNLKLEYFFEEEYVEEE